MKKKLTTNDILNELGFSIEEREVFLKCIQVAKDAQYNETIDTEKRFEQMIEEAIGNEV